MLNAAYEIILNKFAKGMDEKNRDTLKAGLRQLPEFAPPDDLWKAISKGIDQPDGNPLQDAIRQLTAYDPPPELWQKLVLQLEDTHQRGRWINPMVGVAATMLLLVVGWWQFGSQRTAPERISFTFTEEQAYTLPELAELSPDDPADEVLALLETQAAFTNPREQQLRSDLQDINKAREELKTAIDLYGRDGDLLRKLARIERERSFILKALAAQIIKP